MSTYRRLAFVVAGVIVVSSLAIAAYLYAQPRGVVPADTTIKMEKGMCLGRCPVYKLTLYADGLVVYEGELYVLVTGRRESRIDPQKIRELLIAFEKIEFENMPDHYQISRDTPDVALSLTTGGRSKSVQHWTTAPRQLFELEDKIDELVNSAQWVGQ